MSHPETFRRYWCMTPDGIGLCYGESQDGTMRWVQFEGFINNYYVERIRPATFREYLFRENYFGNGIPYPLAAVWALFFTGCTVFAVFGGDEFPELGWRIFAGLFGPVVMAVIVLTMYHQFKRGR